MGYSFNDLSGLELNNVDGEAYFIYRGYPIRAMGVDHVAYANITPEGIRHVYYGGDLYRSIGSISDAKKAIDKIIAEQER